MLRKSVHAVALLMAALTVYSCSGDNQNSSQAANQSGAVAATAGQSASQSVPAFAAYDLRGTLRQSSEWVGKQPVVLNFWGTWCPPCRHEIPAFKQLYSEYRDKGVEILGLALDWKDNPETVRKFALENDMQWQMLMADRDTFANYKGTGVPTTFFLDKNGNVVAQFLGPRSYEEFKKAFEAIL
ncbi:MAG: TlpA disulfide reductase family protein [candidate division Zixibacteria bacterium]|nr:TlpA disulfide reductase family protein [candidate division Zixibacteria bacterium]